MTWILPCVALLLAAGAAAVLRPRWLRRRERARFLAPLREVAVRRAGALVERPGVCYVRDSAFTVAFLPDHDTALEPGTPYHVRVEFPFSSSQFLEVWPRGSPFAPLRLTQARDLTLGIPDFDAHFILRADDPGFARGVLAEPVRRSLYGLWAVGGGGRVRLNVWRHKAAVQKEEALAGVYLIPFVEKCLQFRRELEDSIREQEGVQWLDAPPPPVQAACPICASELSRGRVDCLRCKTAHHRECWEWNGGCSMFACGEGRFEVR